MKIAFDNQVFDSQPYGGISRYYNVLAQELLKKKQDVAIFPGIHCNNYLANLPDGVVRGLKVNKYPPMSARAFQFFNHYLANMQINKWQPDVVHETYESASVSPKAFTDVAVAMDGLAPRQRQVMDMVADGMAAVDIAADLGIAVETVKATKKQALSKLRSALD